ncbi:MAG: HypC/HybG/HupF family hydrogenase formation chaperone [Thermodesulfobacteria bacterium]|nr:HypC/HybG/HupF family hydrogenase formation chaperone [Thermodesulfobacteriota bacterium]
MCLGIPMKIVELHYPTGVCEVDGVRRKVNFQLLPEDELQPGDHVIVHVGFAIQKISPEEARETVRLLRELLEHA